MFIGPAGDYYFFKQEIYQHLKNRSGLEYDFIYFLPVKRAVRYFKEQLVDEFSQQATPEPPIYTFYDFILELYQHLPGAKKIVSSTMRLFLVEELLKKNAHRLKFFTSTSANRKGLVRKVDSLLTEFREYGYHPDELKQALEGEDDRRISDFAFLLEAYESLLGDQIIDEAGAIQSVVTRINDAFWEEHFSSVTTIYLNGYGLFTRPMFRFFERVRHLCHLKIKLDYVPENPQLFEHVQPALEELKKLQPVIVQKEKGGVLELSLFNTNRGGIAREKPKLEALIQATQNRAQEIAFIANYIKRIHHFYQIPLHKIGITFPTLEEYAPLIHEVFPRYGIPYNLSTGFQLSQSPLIRSFLLILEVPSLGYEVKKVEQLIASPFFRLSDGEGHIDITFLARELRLTYFHGNWQEDVQKRIDYLKDQQKHLYTDEELEKEQIEEQIELLENTTAVLSDILSTLHRLQKKQPVHEFRKCYLEVLQKFGFLDWYKYENQYTTPAEKEQEYRAFNRFIKLLDQFSWIVSNLHQDEPLDLKEFYQYLVLLVSQATYNVREWPRHGVQIMPRLEILAVEPEVLFFGGLQEGAFPRPYTRDIFFHDDEREEMGLVATEDLLAQDRFIFYQLLTSSANKTIFTYHCFEKEATRVPSNFLRVLAEEFQLRWRNVFPSERFLENSSQLLQQVAERITDQELPIPYHRFNLWLQLQKMFPGERLLMWVQKLNHLLEIQQKDGFGVYEGNLITEREIVEILTNRFQHRAFSITRLETYAACPIKFYFKYLLGLEEKEEIQAGLTALERGQLVHRTLFRFYRTLRDKKMEREPWKHEDLLFQIAHEEFERLPFQGIFFELEKERYFGTAHSVGLWKKFLWEEEQYITQTQFYPAYFELAFGRAGVKKEQDPASRQKPIVLEEDGRKVRIIGKIDRIDVNEMGQAILLDYKTGSYFSRVQEICEGTSLQLPIYAAVLQDLLPEQTLQPVLAAIYQLKDIENCTRIAILYDKESQLSLNSANSSASLPNNRVVDENGEPLTFQDILERSKHFIFQYVESIQHGIFRHTRFPEKTFCGEYCEFRRMCRKDVAKIKRLENQAG
ncbi:MAG: hypothetical protein D6748_14320 [Calditrichaeota bacterium]|nr:MAG: hypothetical protein D6748_14320 [Calditrichota bacterium]